MLNILYSFFVLIVSAPAVFYVTDTLPKPVTEEIIRSNYLASFTFIGLITLVLVSLCVFGYKIAKSRYHTPVKLNKIKFSDLPTILPKEDGVVWNNKGVPNVTGQTLNLNPLMGNVDAGGKLITDYTSPSYTNPSNV